MAKASQPKKPKAGSARSARGGSAAAASSPPRISLDELMRKAANPRTNPASLRRYFLLDEEETEAFAPQLKLNPATVNIPPTPEGRARGDMAINIANSTARMRRTLIFNQRIANGHDGPIIVSEGDSWFQFPILLDDTIDHLIARGHAVRSLDAAGDTLENMIKEGEYLKAIVQTGASVFAFSAGGNDVLGGGALADHLHNFDPARSPADHILPSYEGLLDVAIAGYDKVLRGVEALPGDILILCHGYDKPIPNKGKWLGKPMEKRGIKDKAFQKKITDELIDRFNARLNALIGGFANAKFLDMRGKVGTSQSRWHDELHPTSNAYKAVADGFEAAIKAAKPKGFAAAPGPVPKQGPKLLEKAAAQAKPATARKGISLHVGLNFVDKKHYGSEARLEACESDAHAMNALAKSAGFKKRTVLLNEKATRNAVKEAIATAAAELKAGDIFLYTYSGHGSQAPDFNKDEPDKKDETWCLFDGMLIDDEAYDLWLRFAEGVRVLCLMDCCHSGSNIKASPFEPAPRVRRLPLSVANAAVTNNLDFYRDIGLALPRGEGDFGLPDDITSKPLRAGLRCTVRLISGCQDDQVSLDGDVNGRFTQELLEVWKNGGFKGNYKQFHAAIRKGIAKDGPQAQTPNHMVIGSHDGAFDDQKPFTV
jgi:lysophospholipase L1-like esterase